MRSSGMFMSILFETDLSITYSGWNLSYWAGMSDSKRAIHRFSNRQNTVVCSEWFSLCQTIPSISMPPMVNSFFFKINFSRTEHLTTTGEPIRSIDMRSSASVYLQCVSPIIWSFPRPSDNFSFENDGRQSKIR